MADVYKRVEMANRPKWANGPAPHDHSDVSDPAQPLVQPYPRKKPDHLPAPQHPFNPLDRMRPQPAATAVPHISNSSPTPFVRDPPTPVPLGGVSLDLRPSALNPSGPVVRPDAPAIHIGNEAQSPYNALAKAQKGPPVSPVTSPEPRSYNATNADNGRSRGIAEQGERAFRSVNVDFSISSQRITLGKGSFEIDRDHREFNVHGEESGQVSSGSSSRLGEHVQNSRNINVSSHASDRNHQKMNQDIDSELIAAADKLASLEASESFAAFLESVPQHDLYIGNTVDDSLYASTTSPKRRSKRRVMAIIEQATNALLEARRRSIESESKGTTKPRKESMEKREDMEARLAQEKAALRVVELLHAQGDFSSILERMKDNRDSFAVVKACTGYLEKYCQNDSIFFDLCEEGAVEELLSGVLRFGEKDPIFCSSFCNCMTILSEYRDETVGHLIRAAGVPSAVIDILGQHTTDVSLQVSGCRCLAAVAGASTLSRSAVATLGGPAAVYRAMTKNNASWRDVDLARESLRAVSQIARENERAADFLVQVAALDAVSRSADVFTDHGLEEDILNALRAFTFYDEGRRNIIVSSGLHALTEIMLRNKDPDFLVRCCTFVREVARWRDVECEKAMLESCIAERITSLMQRSNEMRGEEGARVAWYASQACSFLASFGSKSKHRLRDVGAIHIAITILNRRRENHRVVKCATDTLAELAKGEPESKLYAIRYGAIEALSVALELHGNNSRVRNAVQWTIELLSSSQGATRGPAQGSEVHQALLRRRGMQ